MPKNTFLFQTLFFVHGKIKWHWSLPWVFSAEFRLGLAEFSKSSYLFLHGQCLLHWSLFFFCHGKIKRHWYLPWVFSAEFRLGLAEFLKSSYLFFHGHCLLHWSMSLPTFQVHWDKYQQSLESQLIAIMRTGFRGRNHSTRYASKFARKTSFASLFQWMR